MLGGRSAVPGKANEKGCVATVRLPGAVDSSTSSMTFELPAFNDLRTMEDSSNGTTAAMAVGLELGGNESFGQDVCDASGKSTKSNESGKAQFLHVKNLLLKMDQNESGSNKSTARSPSKGRRWSLFASSHSNSEPYAVGGGLTRLRSHSFCGSTHDEPFHFDPANPRDTDPVEFSDREVHNLCTIGEGGGRQMAAKSVKAGIVGEKEARASEDLIREVAVLSRLPSHPNVIKLFGVVRSPRLRVLMEYVEGQSLADYLWDRERWHGYNNWRPSKQQTLAWGLGIMRGLAFLHQQQPVVMHRDLKPGNLMLLEDEWNIKIIDFGLSRPLATFGEEPEDEGARARKGLFSRQLTMATGTFRYMAPEVWAGEDYSEKADVYSAALILWELAAGQKAFFEQEDQLQSSLKRAALRPPLARASLPALRPILQAAWHTDPAARPDSATVVRQLEKIGAVVPAVSGKPKASHRDKCVVQ